MTEYDGYDYSKLDKERKAAIDAVFNEDTMTSPFKKIKKKKMNPIFKAELEELIGRYYDLEDEDVSNTYSAIVEAFNNI